MSRPLLNIVTEPIAYRATLWFHSDLSESVRKWACQHSHATPEEAEVCATTQLDHMLEMVKP